MQSPTIIARKNLRILLPIVALIAVLGMVLYYQLEDDDWANFMDNKTDTPVENNINTPAENNIDISVENKVDTLGPDDSSKNFIKVSTQDDVSGTVRHVFTNNVQKPEVDNTLLVVALFVNSKSFGRDRTWKDFMDVIGSLDYAKDDISLAFFCGTNELFDEVDTYAEELFASKSPYRKLTLLKADFLRSNFRASNHDPKVQRERRGLIARARNYLLLNSLDFERYTLFMDADIVQITHTDMVKRFVASGKDILVPRIQQGGNRDYDLNSWRGTRIKPTPEQEKLFDEHKWDEANFDPNSEPADVKKNLYHLGMTGDLETSLDYMVPLDSVGGGVLFAKSIIYKQGVLFPPVYIIGTTWQRQGGYDGIESEGLCYIASLVGYLCWGMPNLVAHHTVLHAV